MTRPLALFEGFGIEMELTVVDAETLNVRPCVDELLRAAAGVQEWVDDVEDGPIGWSNELVAHVVELKNAGPAPSLHGVATDFQRTVTRANALLAPMGARLLPGAAHPWMVPREETLLWPHAGAEIYGAYDRLFDCRRHGWANLQSVHLNLPFASNDEFARLMAATRLVLPLVPALAAASPVLEGTRQPNLDERLALYRSNSSLVPAMTGDVIPEPIYDPHEYRTQLFGAIDAQLMAVGADPLLVGAPFTNARGAIARFDRNAIEIRLIDAQECVSANLAVAAAVAAVVRALVEERFVPHRLQRDFPTARLSALLHAAIESGPQVLLEDREYASLFDFDSPAPRSLGELWQHLVDVTFDGPSELEPALLHVLRRGTLAQRMLEALGDDFQRPDLERLATRLCDCLAEDRAFTP